MPKINIPLIQGDKVNDIVDYRDSLPINAYAVQKKILGAAGYMLTYPGLTFFATSSGVDRGAVYNERFEEQFRISGHRLIKVNTDGTSSDLGSLGGVGQGVLENFYSFNTQGVIVNGQMYLYDEINGLVKITDPDLGTPIDGVWIDGYYFLTDGEYIYHTDITDESSIDPLKFATAEFMPDPSLGVAKTQDNKVMVFGRYSLEYFINVATENFAFQRVETRGQKIGIVATHAKCESKGYWYITGGRKEESIGIYRLGVGSAEKLSTREIESILAEYTEPELADMRMESRSENGVSFILIHLPNETLCFNINIAEAFGPSVAWSLLKTGTLIQGNYTGINGVFDPRLGKWYYGDKQNQAIGELDNSVCTHYGDMVEASIFTPLLKLESFSLDEVAIETVPGYSSEKVTVAVSTTINGIIYSNEWWALYGEPGSYSQRFLIRRLGYVENIIGLKFRVASPERVAFAGLSITYG